MAHDSGPLGYGTQRDPRHDPDRVDPTKQGGRPLMVTLVPVGLLLALSALVLVYVLSR